ncbi:hypothetical protein AcetOrient_orf00092p (plasmid) [Acetobacter orientalis]|uniref:Uncharacterized protein n=1 Tax=Acetobacter orientalis TaxID=146474 RepID=A0A2Z5ZMT1_9PROT|nr:hypothetical protein AcetOrient_orf00092p [Acetobacter orientalis]
MVKLLINAESIFKYIKDCIDISVRGQSASARIADTHTVSSLSV